MMVTAMVKKTTKTDAESYYKSLSMKVYWIGANENGRATWQKKAGKQANEQE